MSLDHGRAELRRYVRAVLVHSSCTDEALRAASGELEQLWSALTRSQRQVLGAVAEGRTHLLSAASLETMGLGKSTAQAARDVLVAEGQIRREDSALAIADPFVGRWLG